MVDDINPGNGNIPVNHGYMTIVMIVDQNNGHCGPKMHLTK